MKASQLVILQYRPLTDQEAVTYGTKPAGQDHLDAVD